MIGYLRGHKVIWKENKWYYEDTGLEYDDSRPCPFCHNLPTEEGYDACLGYLTTANTACCGHGVHEGYINVGTISAPYGWWNNAYVGHEQLMEWEKNK